jgi:hypothetical protein
LIVFAAGRKPILKKRADHARQRPRPGTSRRHPSP